MSEGVTAAERITFSKILLIDTNAKHRQVLTAALSRLIKGVEVAQPEMTTSLLPDEDYNWPAYDLLRADEYLHRTGIWRNVCMHTSRGCPNNCRYCYRIFGHKVRYRTVDSILEEIRYLHERFGARTITFEDDDFPRHRRRLEEFCEKVMSSDIKLMWKCCARVDSVNDEILKVQYSE